MSLLLAIIIGLLVGAGGGFLLQNNIDHLLMNILFGLSGGIAGLVFYALFLSSNDGTAPLFNAPSVLTSALGACVFVLGFNGLNKLTPDKSIPVNNEEFDHQNSDDEKEDD